MKIVLSPNPYRDKGLKAAQSAARILNNAQVETCICLPFSTEGANIDFPKHVHLSRMEEELPNADALVCFGGDGTILHAAKDANAYGIPILGVNLGSVGFMAEVELGELSLLSKLAVDAAHYNINIAKAGHMPILALNADYTYNGITDHGFPQHKQDYYWSSSAGVSLSIPLFEGGKVSSQVAQKELAYEQAVAAYQNKMKNQAFLIAF